ncbi:MAG: hypothetical protein HRU20_18455 [Pseudomonadales bacterium]|nr:hypothetical protein [Pseudomonadales bacterium]
MNPRSIWLELTPYINDDAEDVHGIIDIRIDDENDMGATHIAHETHNNLSTAFDNGCHYGGTDKGILRFM